MAAGVKPPAYTKEILRLAAGLPDLPPIAAPDASASLRSPTCGATIALTLRAEQGRVTEIAAQVSACAYGQAAAALMLAHARGCDRAAAEGALIAIEDWLNGSSALAPDWPGMAALAPARERPGRHGAILLPFRALARAMEDL
ncbi:iron-sulfur cluster assembly scaffold protein [Sphingomicrobium astaxanthinifaciens]|uniref:iron-sulfur cluster assembly scaffold protein n=1 Tax=Sphingomicrobium astaxanthinifaciens TaxID=1227949 RepID=UPI001FCA7D72|nr:iron-sulfur cluster assembly scaffold protein [Sphingomicrobium astaxanthinifaciens]MCJ7420632.1 iron-sulfur cluster assembly scaffold protein [Sphingomicrobium astaxanthinifaciens]